MDINKIKKTGWRAKFSIKESIINTLNYLKKKIKMKIAVVGLWHLGTITALSLSKLNNLVYAFDEKKLLINST